MGTSSAEVPGDTPVTSHGEKEAGVPLNRATVTVASRVMLPAYVALAGWYGLIFLFAPFNRLKNSHSLAAQKELMGGSMWPWGALFLGLSAFLLVQMIRESRRAYVLGLGISAAAWVGWTILIFVRSEEQ